MFERGQVCWAAAASMRRRLTDLISHQHDPPLEPALVESAYRECVKERKVVLEHLVASGVATKEGLRRALRQHIAESMALLSDPAIKTRWVGQERSGYDPAFAFSTGELLANIGALWDVGAACEATARLRRVAEPATCFGVGFARTASGDLLPVAHCHSAGCSVAELLALGGWIGHLPEVLAGVIGRPEFASYKHEDGRTALGWIEGRIGYALVCGSPTTIGHVVSRILGAG